MPKLSNSRFSNYALDKFVAPKLSELTQCGIPNITSRWEEAEHWIANFILNSMLRVSIDSKPKQYIIFFLGRSESAVREYNAA